VNASLGQGDPVEGRVQLAVAVAVEAVALGSARGGRDRRAAGEVRELGIVGEAIGAGDLADQLAGGERSDAGDLEQRWAVALGALADLRGELALATGEVADPRQQVGG
jgi:hypothetical protein